MTRNLCISFSGGRTSAFMARWCQQNLADEYDDIRYVFANTGQEHEKTLEFVARCDREWGLGVTWIEAVAQHGKRKGSAHRVVAFETASRDGAPFEDVIRKYGIPNKAYPHCTRELKLNPIRSLLVEWGWDGDCDMAVGIRADEVDRMQADAQKKRLVYPLVSRMPMTKGRVEAWWSQQSFDLGITEIHGNCKWCWKKSQRKLMTLARRHPEYFEFPKRMEREHGLSGHNVDGTPRVFFREGRSTDDLFREARAGGFVEWRPGEGANGDLFDELDLAGACSESCEVEF